MPVLGMETGTTTAIRMDLLGGEVWRSGDGTTWTRVNAPGFGNLEAHRVERLMFSRTDFTPTSRM